MKLACGTYSGRIHRRPTVFFYFTWTESQAKASAKYSQVRRDQLRRTGEKLSEDLALYVTRRETAADKGRAAAALEKAHGATQHSRSAHYHKLRLARADATRLNKARYHYQPKVVHC